MRERRDQLVHPAHSQARARGHRAQSGLELGHHAGCAATQKWQFFYLYVLLDIFSRYVVGWLVAGAENAGLASALIEETCAKHGIARDTLTLHSDRGSPMRAKTTAELLVDLGVAASLLAAAGVQRQPVLGGPVQDAQVSARVPRRASTGLDQARSSSARASSPGTTTSTAIPGSAS